MDKFSKKIKDTIKKYCLIKKGDRILVGVSAGPDSLALLLALYSLRKEMGISLYVGHLDHMLRRESKKDREFVQTLAKRLGLVAVTDNADIKSLAKNRSLEEVAREARINFFLKVARKLKANKVALAHNLDDQAETVLMRVLRGAGLSGLSGILPKRKIYSIEFIRPLIETRRRDIEAYLKRRKIVPRRDRTNLQDIYLRNRIRNRLLPQLEKEYNRNVKEVLANLAQCAACDYDYIEEAAGKHAGRNKLKFNLKKLALLHPSLRRSVFRSAIAVLKGDTRRIEFRHILEIESLIQERPDKSIVDLPKGVSVVKKKNTLRFYRRT